MSGQWRGDTDGTPFMQRSLTYMTRGVGLYFIYAVTSVVSLVYFFTHTEDRRVISGFYRRCFGYGKIKALWNTYRNFFIFGRIIMDRFAAYGGRKFKVEIVGQKIFDELASREEGFIQLSSHIGNYEMAGYMLPILKKRLNALVYSGETETVMKNRKRIFEANNINMILTSDDMGHVYEINDALCRGEVVSMPADRIFGSQKSLEVPFFDGKIRLPMGPFALAAQRDTAVGVVFVLKESAEHYKVFESQLVMSEEELQGNIRSKMTALAAKYSAALEDIVRRYPLQWFNYLDVFAKE